MAIIIRKPKNVKTEELKAPMKAKEGPVLNPIANAMRATGGKMPAVLLLQRINHWMEWAKVEKHGEKWIVNSAGDWAAEAGLTPDQYKAAKKVLEEANLIVSKQMPFGRRNLTHIRLTSRAKALLNEKRPAKVTKPKPQPEAHIQDSPTHAPKPTNATKEPKKSWAELDAETDAIIAAKKTAKQ